MAMSQLKSEYLVATAAALLQALHGLNHLAWPNDAAHAWWQTLRSNVTKERDSSQLWSGTLPIAPRDRP